jgi:hypothetical protein
MNEKRYGYHCDYSGSLAALTPPLVSVCLPEYGTPADRVDKALERLQLHLTYGPYAGWKDTIRQDVEAVLEAWRECQREQGAA